MGTLGVALILSTATHLSAQVRPEAFGYKATRTVVVDETTTATTIGGALLGITSATVMGSVGSLIPCSQTYAGPTCVRASAIVSGAVGVTTGLVVGSTDGAVFHDRLGSAGIGALVGTGVALVAAPLAEGFGFTDGLAVVAIAGSFGATYRGSAIGLGVGAGVGAALWALLPAVKPPDALAITLGGMAIGSLTDWIVSAVNAKEPTSTSLFSFTVPLP